MKLKSLLIAFALVLSYLDAPAQLIQSGGATYQFITLTVPGPIIVIGTTLATATGGSHSQLTATVSANSTVVVVLGGPNQPVIANAAPVPASIDQGTDSLPAGNYEVAFNYTTQFTLIAPNEPPSGLTTALNTINTEITNLQTQEMTDSTNITNLTNQVNGLVTQLQTIDTTLQNEINTDEGNIATLTSELQTLQGQTQTNTTAIADLTNELHQVETKQTADEATIAQLQAELAGLPAGGTSVVNTSTTAKRNNNLAWAGIGLGASGIGIGLGALFSSGDDSSPSSSTTGSKSSTGSTVKYQPDSSGYNH